MRHGQNIFIIDADDTTIKELHTLLDKKRYNPLHFSSVQDALAKITDKTLPAELILVDTHIPKLFSFIGTVQKMDRNIPIILMTKNCKMDDILKGLKMGACDHLPKPINNEELLLRINRAMNEAHMQKEINYLKEITKEKNKIPEMIGVSHHIKSIINMIEKIARSNAKTVLIMGDSGTGKELVAQSLHGFSTRSKKPFVILNCAAIPSTLLETELMGHEKGAYTDAKAEKKGLLELADGGTLFLDEIGDMDILMQAKLLRILEDRTFRRVGGVRDITVDIRIVAATNASLKKQIEEKKFRQDLYYRLLVVPIYLPPLRERKEDILVLANYFISHFNKEFNKNVKGISDGAKKILLNYRWPGNIREMKNVIERALILENHDYILADHLPHELIMPGENEHFDSKHRFVLPPEGIALEDVEKSLVKQALLATSGKQVQAAKLLHITRDSFRRRMKKYDFR